MAVGFQKAKRAFRRRPVSTRRSGLTRLQPRQVATTGRPSEQRRLHLSAVTAVFIVEVVREEPARQCGLLVALAVDEVHAEHAVRAVGVGLVACPQTPRLPVDVTIFAPDALPPWLSESGVAPLWERSAGTASCTTGLVG